jgi:Ala-tRNA(Pro) deacylase
LEHGKVAADFRNDPDFQAGQAPTTELTMRVADYLTEKQVSFETKVHPPAFTAQRRAQYLHVSAKQLAKSVLLAGPTQFVLAVLPADHHVDLTAVARELGHPYRLANHLEIADVFRDCEWGALAPFGKLYGVNTIVDEIIDPKSQIVFEAQMHAITILMSYRDFERLESPHRFRFAFLPEQSAPHFQNRSLLS